MNVPHSCSPYALNSIDLINWNRIEIQTTPSFSFPLLNRLPLRHSGTGEHRLPHGCFLLDSSQSLQRPTSVCVRESKRRAGGATGGGIVYKWVKMGHGRNRYGTETKQGDMRRWMTCVWGVDFEGRRIMREMGNDEQLWQTCGYLWATERHY